MLVLSVLAEFAFYLAFCSVVRLHLYLQTTEVGERNQFSRVRVSRHRHCEVRCQRTVLGFPIASPLSQLYNILHIVVHGLHLIVDLGFGQCLLQFFNRKRTH
jgi:hypothetical protein